MLTIEPRPASRIAGPNTWMARKVPVRLTSTVAPNASDGTSSIACRSAAASGGWSIPALLTSTSGAPSSAIRSRTASSEARSVTSPCSRRHAGSDSPSDRTSMPTTRAPAPARALTQTGPSFPSAPVTMASEPSSGRSSDIERTVGAGRDLRDGLLQQLEGERRLLVHRLAQRSAEEALDLVRRQPIARRLGGDVRGAEHVPGGKRSRRHELLRHLHRRHDLAGIHLLRPVAEGDVRPLEVADHLREPLRLEREGMVGAAHRAVEREVLLNDPAAEHV